MLQNNYRRHTCRLCDSENLIKCLKLENIPTSDFYLDSKEESLNAPRYPIDIYQCLECLHIQQLDVVNPSELWDNYTYYSGSTPNMPRHFQEEYKEIHLHYSEKISNKFVVEVGSNDGSFLTHFRANGWKVLGIDPAPGPAKLAIENNIDTINDFFGEELYRTLLHDLESQPGLILMYNAFAHMDNVQEILSVISCWFQRSKPAIFRFEVQYAKNLIDNCLIASIFHEHVSHYSLLSLSRFLAKNHMYIVDAKVVDIQHGSLVVTTALIRDKPLFHQTKNVMTLLKAEASSESVYPSGLKKMSDRLDHKRQVIHQFIDSLNCKKIAGFGAARSASTILTQLHLSDLVSKVFDDNPIKANKFIYGEGIPIENPILDQLTIYPCIVILAWVHSEHIIKRLSDYLEYGGTILTIFPNVKVNTKSDTFFLE